MNFDQMYEFEKNMENLLNEIRSEEIDDAIKIDQALANLRLDLKWSIIDRPMNLDGTVAVGEYDMKKIIDSFNDLLDVIDRQEKMFTKKIEPRCQE